MRYTYSWVTVELYLTNYHENEMNVKWIIVVAQHIHQLKTFIELEKADLQELGGLLPIGLRNKLYTFHEQVSTMHIHV